MSKRKPYRAAATQPAQNAAAPQPAQSAAAPQPAQSATVTSPAAIQQTAAQPEEDIFIQFCEEEISIAEISKKAKEDFRTFGNEGDIKTVKIYIKPEDNKAYYVINDVEGNVDLIQKDSEA